MVDIRTLPRWFRWVVVFVLFVVLGILVYAVFDNRKIEFWPPMIHSKDPVNGREDTDDDRTIEDYIEFVEGLPDITKDDMRIIMTIADRGGKVTGYRLLRLAEEDGFSVNEETITRFGNYQIAEGDLNSDITLTRFGNILARMARRLEVKSSRNGRR